jgi:GT2 family glycosyltransferase
MAGDVQVDIVIVSWNRPDETIAAVASALAQTGVRRRVHVLDQGSDPPNIARVKAFCADKPDVTLQCLERNIGIAEGRNRVIAMGTAPIIIGLDSDAVFDDPGCAARAAARMAGDERLGIIAFRILDSDTRRESHWDYPAKYREAETFETTRFLGGGHAMRRAAYEAVGGFDGALFFIGEERDIAWRIINAGYRIRWFRDIAVLHEVDARAKVTWGSKRYYFTVRNTMYVNYKFGMSAWRQARAAIAFVVRGVANGVIRQAVAGVMDSIGMMRRFRRNATAKDVYQLSPETRGYIAATDMHGESLLNRVRRQFSSLPRD